MEADLARYYQIDYRDRWRKDPDGRPRLTVRQIGVYLRGLPVDSAIALALNDGEPEWTRLEVLQTDVWSAITGKEHPRIAEARKKAKGRKPETAEQMQRRTGASRRRRRRQQMLDSGQIPRGRRSGERRLRNPPDHPEPQGGPGGA